MQTLQAAEYFGSPQNLHMKKKRNNSVPSQLHAIAVHTTAAFGAHVTGVILQKTLRRFAVKHSHTNNYLTDPVIPSTKFFCNAKNTIAVGMVVINTASINIP